MVNSEFIIRWQILECGNIELWKCYVLQTLKYLYYWNVDTIQSNLTIITVVKYDYLQIMSKTNILKEFVQALAFVLLT